MNLQNKTEILLNVKISQVFKNYLEKSHGTANNLDFAIFNM